MSNISLYLSHTLGISLTSHFRLHTKTLPGQPLFHHRADSCYRSHCDCFISTRSTFVISTRLNFVKSTFEVRTAFSHLRIAAIVQHRFGGSFYSLVLLFCHFVQSFSQWSFNGQLQASLLSFFLAFIFCPLSWRIAPVVVESCVEGQIVLIP